MLIRKRNFLCFKLCLACLSMLLACSVGFEAQAAPHAASRPIPHVARSPDAVAVEFYGWYLETLSADHDPISDRYDTFVRYVARDLAARLADHLRAGQLPDSDYFTQSASYRQGLLRSVRATVVRQRAGTAEVRVTLGNDGNPMRVLSLTMVLENGAWKIRTVAPSTDNSPKSSAEQPVI